MRSALDAQAAKLAELVATLEARDADRQAAQAHFATLTAAAEQWRADAERAAAEQQAVVAGLRSTLEAQAAELVGLAGALEARDAVLEAAQAQVVALTAAAEQRRAEVEHAASAHQAEVTGLRGELGAQAADLAGLVTTLAARDADLKAAQAQVASLTAMAEQWRKERDALLASWSWRTGLPFRLAGHAARAMIVAFRPGRPPLP